MTSTLTPTQVRGVDEPRRGERVVRVAVPQDARVAARVAPVEHAAVREPGAGPEPLLRSRSLDGVDPRAALGVLPLEVRAAQPDRRLVVPVSKTKYS